MFLDRAVISIASGNGGNGIIHWRREKFAPKGGPDGGNGGRGGDIIFVANPNMTTLLDFRYKQHYQAAHGKPGGGANWTGKSGKDTVIQVPCGTIIHDAETNEVLADLTEAGQEVVMAAGGRGGRGNSEFATSTNQAPRHAEEGKPGEEKRLALELKLIADIGLVGFPNAGKSTLISSISAAKPKIADYPFTTLVPNLGIVSLSEDSHRQSLESFCVADIPGLIEGAHTGKGLGFQFLRHVERTQVLVFLLDPLSEIPPKDQFKLLRKELKLFNKELDAKERIICFTKMDALTDEDKTAFRKTKLRGEAAAHCISGVSGEGLDELKRTMWNALQRARNLAE
ncbi:MAG: GTPase ObgE [Candidatus Kapaibacterium sp.]|nr:MAG: GTPase ObgE [Candidatus Kapabacteria bacterium]